MFNATITTSAVHDVFVLVLRYSLGGITGYWRCFFGPTVLILAEFGPEFNDAFPQQFPIRAEGFKTIANTRFPVIS